jgi:hypothetical protein
MATSPSRRRRWWLVALIALVVLAVLGGWLMLHDQHADHSASGERIRITGPPETPVATRPVSPSCAAHWFPAPDLTPVPRSNCYGPKQLGGGLAKGFSHDTLGAVYAAINIGARITSAAGPAVYRPTLEQQTVGDSQAAITDLAGEQSDTPSSQTRPDQWWWRIGAGDPAADLVEVDLAASTPQTRALGEFAQLTYALVWSDGDWKIQLPRQRATPVNSVAGYTSLGVITVGGGN